MGDNEFRNLRRPPVETDPDYEMTDPLAELARLIGQGGLHGAAREDAAAQAEAPPEPASIGRERAAPGHQRPPQGRFDRPPAQWRPYSPPLSGHEDNDPYRDGAQEQDGQEPDAEVADAEEQAARAYAAAQQQAALEYAAQRHAAQEGAAQDHAYQEHAGYDDEPRAAAHDAESLDGAPADAGDYSDAERGYSDADGDYSDGDYDEGYDEPYEEEPSGTLRRSRTASLVVGIVGLIALGSAGAFGYRALFGGASFPALPPIIKPSGAPVKIVPNHDAQAAAPNQAAANAGAGEHLVSHQEQPVEVHGASPPAKGVTTLPVVSNTAPAGALPGTPPSGVVASAGSEATGTASEAKAPAADKPAAPPPKPVHTQAIHTDRSGNPAAPRDRAARAGGGAGPLSLAPGGQTEAPFPRTRHAEATPASPPSAAPPAQTGSMAGGYAVQVSSQRSEADAQATLNAMQAKYPQQLGSQRGMVRRADLGAKGVYYRALVGPFGTAEEASRLCSSLKAAGGTCIIQKI